MVSLDKKAIPDHKVCALSFKSNRFSFHHVTVFSLNIRKANKVNAEKMVELDHLDHLDLKYAQINLKSC